MEDAYIIGIGMNMLGKHREETVRTMAENVIRLTINCRKKSRKNRYIKI